MTKESIRVIVVDPFENNEAKALVSKSARYASGYWVVKMFVWKFEEYAKMVYMDADRVRGDKTRIRYFARRQIR